MIRQLHKAKQIISIVLLMAFSMVYVTDLLCDFGILNVYDTFSHNSHSHEHQSIPNHTYDVIQEFNSESNQHSQAKENTHRHSSLALMGYDDFELSPMDNSIVKDQHDNKADTHSNYANHHSNDVDGHNHDESTDNDSDDCCTEETDAVYNSLISHSISDISTIGKYFLLNTTEQSLFAIVGLLDSNNTLHLYYDLPPPETGFFIRIFIQSFLD